MVLVHAAADEFRRALAAGSGLVPSVTAFGGRARSARPVSGLVMRLVIVEQVLVPRRGMYDSVRTGCGVTSLRMSCSRQ
jgi:hypothetical protein